tara:strand:+ start:2350 stop:2535 length:186 start_codon:yes stop_codon:yes gene_type:complete
MLIYLMVETDDPQDQGYAFLDLEDFLADWNADLDTEYTTLQEFNDGEEYRYLYVINTDKLH